MIGSVTVSDAQDDASWIGPLASTTTAVVQPGRFTLESLSSVSALPRAQSSIHPSLRLLSLEFNVGSSILSHVAARQAVAHAIDRSILLNRLFGTIAPTMTVNQDHLSVAGQTSYSASTAAGEYAHSDPAATESLFKSLGYDRTPSTPFVDATGKAFSLRLAVETGDPWIDQLAIDVTAQLRSAGIDVVIVPVEDGGYGLIGMQRPQPGLFADMRWSTASVMAETRRRLTRLGLSWREPARLWDIDVPADLARLSHAGLASLMR